MTRPLAARVDWKEGYLNDPKLRVLVDEIPARSELRFERHDDGLWYAEKDGYVEYFAWVGPGNEGGYAGSCYEITTADGEQITLRGPWSSRAGAVNKRGFGPCVDVSLTTKPEVFERGFTFQAGSLTLGTAKQAVDLVDDASHLEQVVEFDEEPYWRPVRAGDEP